jgi:nicotinate-nucleotide adenylyltransferase
MPGTIIYGGSFDPLHIIHLTIAEQACHALKADRVLFIPSGRTPLKTQSATALYHRAAMLQNTLENLSWADLCLYEIEKALAGSTEPSYSYCTVKYLIRHGLVEERPYFLLGDDWNGGFLQWYKGEELSRAVHIVIANRGYCSEPFPYAHIRLDNELFALSSSQIRRYVRNGVPYRYLVPPSVYDYINTFRLYRE